jgi:protein tyrosine kinase modulator
VNPVETEYLADDGGSAPLLDPRGLIERRWKFMLPALVLGVLASVGFSLQSEPVFVAEATVLVAPQQVSQRIVEPTIQEDSLARIDALAAEVLSRSNLAKLIEQFDLYPSLRKRQTMGEVVRLMRKAISIRAVETTEGGDRGMTARAYALRYEAKEPEAAAKVANALASLFVDTSFEERHRQHRLTSEFLRRELDRAEQELREQNRKIAEFKQGNRALLPSDLQANLTRLDMLQNQRQSLSLQIAEAGTRIATLASDDRDSPRQRLAALREEVARQRSSKTDKHPDVLEAQRQLAEYERQLGSAGRDTDSPDALRRAAERTLDVLRSQLAATDREINELDASIGKMPEVQEGLASLEEKGTILRETYLDFLRKVQDAELDENLLKAQQGERVSVLNPAEPPSEPARGRTQYLAFGLLASLGLAVVVGLALEFLDPVVISAEQVARLTGLSSLGSVDRIR